MRGISNQAVPTQAAGSRDTCTLRMPGVAIIFVGLCLGGIPAVRSADSPIDQARVLLDKGQLKEAEALLVEVIKSNPENFDARRLLGLAYMQSRQYIEAVSHLEKAVQLNSDSPDAWKGLGEAYFQVQEPTKAASALARSLALKPDQPTLHYTLGMHYLGASDYGQAATHLEQARAHGLNHSGLLLNLGRANVRLKRLDEGVDVLNELLRASPRDWRMQLDVGKLLFENLMYDNAQQALNSAWELNRDSYEAGFYKALAHYLRGEHAESLKVLLELKAQGPQSLEVKNLLGCVYAKLGQKDDADKTLRNAIQEAPDRPDAYFNLGLIMLEQGKRKEAEALLERGGALFLGDAKIFYILGSQQGCQGAGQSLRQPQQTIERDGRSPERAQFYLQLGKVFEQRFHYTSAAELLHIASKLEPNNPEILLMLGISCFNLDDLVSSLAIFQHTISLQPDSHSAYYFLGNNYASLGKDLEAVDSYRQAIRLAPQNHVYYFRLGKALFRLGQMEESLAAYKSALSLAPNNAPTHCAIGRVYQRLEEEELAASEFREAIGLDPGYPEPYYHLAKYYARKKQLAEAQKFSAAFARKTALARKTPGQYAYVRARE